MYRDYQQLCHDIIQRIQGTENALPYRDKGVDIDFSIANTSVTFDAVLKTANGKIIVIESKRYEKQPIEQRDVFALWGEMDWLRRTLNTEVEGLFITKSTYRIGAIKAATALGIRVAVCEAEQNVQQFLITFHRYAPHVSGRTNGVVKEHFMQVTTQVVSSSSLHRWRRRKA
jgi:hypothetical protein